MPFDPSPFQLQRSIRPATNVWLMVTLGLLLCSCGFLGDEAEPTPTPEPGETPAPTATKAPTPSPTPTRSPASTPAPTATPGPETDAYGYEIINTFPHDRSAFTQGLEYRNGLLYESTGLRGESTLRRVELETGQVLDQVELDDDLFGEGLTVYGDRIFQLTWTEGTGFVYDRESLERTGEFSYDREGWGLTNDGERLIMSDGSNRISFRDPETFDEIEEVEVRGDRGPVQLLNELEYINGEIWANVWQEDIVVVIDPETGWVNRRIDLTGLLQPEDRGDRRVDVLNGIAYDAENERIFLTGKLWPVLYEVRVVPVDDESPEG